MYAVLSSTGDANCRGGANRDFLFTTPAKRIEKKAAVSLR
jgi:hypothetical protein